MSRYGKPIKNKKHKDPRYFLNEEQEQEELELLQENNPLGGDEGTRVGPEDENPLGGDHETRTPNNPKGVPIEKRVATIEKILKDNGQILSVQIANDNSEGQIVLSGKTDDLDKLQEKKDEPNEKL